MTNETTRGNARTDDSSTGTDSKTAPNRHNPSFYEELLVTDGGHLAPDLTEFQVQCLVAIALTEGQTYGLAIKRRLETFYGQEVNHGRLYPNLDELVDRGLVEKWEIDKRTNGYDLTADGVRVLEARLDRLGRAVDAYHADGDESEDEQDREPAVADGGDQR